MIGFLVTVGIALLAPTLIRAVRGGGRYENTPAGQTEKTRGAVYTHWMFLGAALVFGGLFFLANVFVVVAGVMMLVAAVGAHSTRA